MEGTALSDTGVLELEVRSPLAVDELRQVLLATGAWVEDPIPWLRRRLKPWVVWSVRERRVGLALHVEREKDMLSVHLDTLNPGAWWPLAPLHALIDLWGWRTWRMARLRRVIRKRGS